MFYDMFYDMYLTDTIQKTAKITYKYYLLFHPTLASLITYR